MSTLEDIKAHIGPKAHRGGGKEYNFIKGMALPSLQPTGDLYAKASVGTPDVTTQPTFFYSPELTPDVWLLPKGRVEELRWCQIHFNLNPYVHSIINMHARYPFSNFRLKYKDAEIEQQFNSLLFKNKSFDWYEFILQMSLSYWKYGEAVVFGDWSEAEGTWNYLTLLPPTEIDYREDTFSGEISIEMIPTTVIKNKVRDALLQGRVDIHPALIDAVQNNKKIPLDTKGREGNIFTGELYSPPKAFVWARIQEPGEVRGSSIIKCLFKDLIFADKIRLAQMACADRHALPIELWTVGQLGATAEASMLPGPEMLEDMRAMITQATQQPPFVIVAGPYLKYEALGVSGKLLSIYDDLGYVENQILVGLGVNKNVVLAEGPSLGSSKTVALHRLIREYTTVRKLMENFLKINIILPIAKAHNIVDKKGEYIIPDIAWDLSLTPETDKENFDIAYKMWKDGLLSTETLYSKCPFVLDYKLEQQRLISERGSVYDKGDKRLGKKAMKKSDAGGLGGLGGLGGPDGAGDLGGGDLGGLGDLGGGDLGAGGPEGGDLGGLGDLGGAGGAPEAGGGDLANFALGDTGGGESPAGTPQQ